MKTWSLQEKPKVQQMLWTYEDRYKNYKELGWDWRKTQPITKAIRSKKRTLALLAEREKAVVKLARQIEDFMDVKIFHRSSSIEPQCVMAKNIFYKAGLEEGHVCSSLAWYTGCTLKHPERQRRNFQRSFTTNPVNKKYWNDFKNWTKLNDDDTTKMADNNPGLPNRSEGERKKESQLLDSPGSNWAENSQKVQRPLTVYSR